MNTARWATAAIAAGLLLASAWAVAAGPDTAAPGDDKRKVRLVSEPAAPTAPRGDTLASQVSLLLGLGVAAVLVWRMSGATRRRRRRHAPLGRRARLKVDLRPDDENPFNGGAAR